MSVLEMYGFCLRKLDRVDEYIRIALRTISKAIVSKNHGMGRNASVSNSFISSAFAGPAHVQEIVSASVSLSQPIAVPLQDFFTDLYVDPYLQHLPDESGFSLDVSFKSNIPTYLKGAQLSIKLNSISDAHHREINLETESSVDIKTGSISASVISKVPLFLRHVDVI